MPALNQISRSLREYGGRVSNIAARATRRAGDLNMAAANARARGIESRGNTLGQMASGLGGMVGDAMLNAPRREMEMESAQLGLEGQRNEMAMRQEAAQRQKLMDEVLTEFSDPVQQLEEMQKRGLGREAQAYKGQLNELRQKASDMDKEARKEMVASMRQLGLLADFEGIPEEDIAEVYAGRRMNASTLGLPPEMVDAIMPATPNPGALKALNRFSRSQRTFADWLERSESLSKLDREGLQTEEERLTSIGKRLEGVSDAKWPQQRQHLLNRVPEQDREYFAGLIPEQPSEDARALLKSYYQEEQQGQASKSALMQEYGEYRRQETEGGRDPLGIMQYQQEKSKSTPKGTGTDLNREVGRIRARYDGFINDALDARDEMGTTDEELSARLSSLNERLEQEIADAEQRWGGKQSQNKGGSEKPISVTLGSGKTITIN